MEDYKKYAQQLRNNLLYQKMLPRRKEKWKGPIIEPGNKGYNEKMAYPWSLEGKVAGIPQKNISIDLYGWIIMDRRTSPHTMIWKNHEAKLVHGFRPCLAEQPKPFESYQEAEMYIKKMHLSMEEKDFVEICALAQKPLPGHPAPNKLILSKKEKKTSSFD